MALKIVSFISAVIIMLTGFVSGLSENIRKLFNPEPPVTYFTTEDVQAKYGKAVRSIDKYADYGFAEVRAEPLADISFDSADNSTGYEINGARLVTGRFGLRKALELSSPEAYLTLPVMGEHNALTVSIWVNIRDLQTRENTDEPRVSTLLDTEAGAGRVTLKFVHTGTPSYADPVSGEAVMGTNCTKLVFSVEGNSGGDFDNNGVCANNT
ncbi:MAG: hypothetical protein IJM02_02990, partial [Clostridia bacterium]|nr:hypothetical protein [Clostridia bacterium]